MRVRVMDGEIVGAYADGIRRVYADAFSGPPWHEDDPAAGHRYVERLATDAARPGFTAALALAPDGAVSGFATAWTTPDPFPTGRAYDAVAAALGPRRTTDRLCGALEVDELAVAPAARGTGTGAALLTAVTAAAPGGRCWLLTSLRAGSALRLYRRAGWHRLPEAVPGRAALTVLLGPAHPDTGAAAGAG